MKKRIAYLAMVVVTSIMAGEKYDALLQQANSMYLAGDKDSAKKLYETAAALGSPEAHYALASQYVLSPQESVEHFAEAAKKGNQDALEYALDGLFFRANSLQIANPQKALELYTTAKKVNPNLHLYEEDDHIQTIQMCAESKGFDKDDFIKKYHLNNLSSDKAYGVWELAEEASHDGKFGKANPKLVFDLVCRGGEVPNEMVLAVKDTYSDWKKMKTEGFGLCNYVMSGYGMGYCASRAEQEDSPKRAKKYTEVNNKLDSDGKKALANAYKIAKSFFELKASQEEGYGGTSYGAMVVSSETGQNNYYLDLLKKIYSGYKPDHIKQLKENDKLLNETYKIVMKKIPDKEEGYDPSEVSVNDVKAVQRLWIPYRDSSAKLFTILNPSVSEDVWKSYLTQIRIEELKALIQ